MITTTRTLTKQTGFLVMVLLLSAALTAGCASRSKTSTSTSVDGTGRSTVVEETTTTTKSESHDRGILGSTFHVIGEIIAFPFEVIAGAFRFIF